MTVSGVSSTNSIWSELIKSLVSLSLVTSIIFGCLLYLCRVQMNELRGCWDEGLPLGRRCILRNIPPAASAAGETLRRIQRLVLYWLFYPASCQPFFVIPVFYCCFYCYDIIRLLSLQIYKLFQNTVRCGNDSGVCLITTLGGNHLCKFGCKVYV